MIRSSIFGESASFHAPKSINCVDNNEAQNEASPKFLNIVFLGLNYDQKMFISCRRLRHTLFTSDKINAKRNDACCKQASY